MRIDSKRILNKSKQNRVHISCDTVHCEFTIPFRKKPNTAASEEYGWNDHIHPLGNHNNHNNTKHNKTLSMSIYSMRYSVVTELHLPRTFETAQHISTSYPMRYLQQAALITQHESNWIMCFCIWKVLKRFSSEFCFSRTLDCSLAWV